MEIKEQSVSIYSNLVKCGEMYVEENLKIRAHLSFDYNPKIEISGPSGIPGIPNSFNTFIRDGGDLMYRSIIHTGMFSTGLRRWVFDCEMEVRDELDNIISTFNLFDKFKTGKVLVSIDSSALGDTLSWLPYIEEFRKKYNVSNLSQFPEISRFDPHALAMCLRPGDVCEFKRESATAMFYSYYRVCI